MSRVVIQIDKEFLDKYREYKIDLLMNYEKNPREDFEYETIQHMINKGFPLVRLYGMIEDNDWIKVEVSTGKIVSKYNKKEEARKVAMYNTMRAIK